MARVARAASPGVIMESLYFVITAVVLYFVADALLQRAETVAGRRFEHRTLVFFAILLTLALVSFALIRFLTSAH